MNERSEGGGVRLEHETPEGAVADGGAAAQGETRKEEATHTSHLSAHTSVSRRRALQVLGAVPIGIMLQQQQQPTPPAPQQPRQPHTTPNQPAHDTSQPERNGSQARNHFFTAKEMRTLRVLADDIIPADARSPSATAVGVPAFIDFHLSVEETSKGDRTAWRGGLRWLDTESRARFGVPYAAAKTAQRHQILDDVSFPNGLPAGTSSSAALSALPHALRYGAAFFARARDMVAAGFFSTPQGWKDLRYVGNVANPEWRGCPEPALAKLGVSYEEYEASLAARRRSSAASND